MTIQSLFMAMFMIPFALWLMIEVVLALPELIRGAYNRGTKE